MRHLSLSALAFAALTPLAHAQNLFEADASSNSIFQFTPAGVKTTFATGLNQPFGLTFDSNGNLYEADNAISSINEFTPSGVKTTFATGLSRPAFLAFGPVAAAVPEPGNVALLVGVFVTGAGFVRKRRRNAHRAA